MTGPLEGIRVVEIGSLGPGPFAGMMLADHGAEVIRVEREDPMQDLMGPLLRSRKSVALDLKCPDDIARLRDLCRTADGLIEGFRPGVMERLGLGPEILMADNPKLVYGRMTGWGQDGPYAHLAGHDINYIALSGVLGACARSGEIPVPPMNLLGDFGGGGMLLAFAMVSALLAVQRGQQGQVIDCAMTDGSALLMTMIWGLKAKGIWNGAAGTNLLDTGAPFYDVYETADGGYISIGSLEPRFFAALCKILKVDDGPDFCNQNDRQSWPVQKSKLTAIFKSGTRNFWVDIFEGSDVCFAPVLTMEEALEHHHNRSRNCFIEVGGVTQPAPAPRYSLTPCAFPTAPPSLGKDQSLLEEVNMARRG